MPNGRAATGCDTNRPHVYASIDEAKTDVSLTEPLVNEEILDAHPKPAETIARLTAERNVLLSACKTIAEFKFGPSWEDDYELVRELARSAIAAAKGGAA